MSKNIEQTMASAGWAEIVARAHARIDGAKLTALSETDEARFIERYRKAHAAHNALLEFVEELEQQGDA